MAVSGGAVSPTQIDNLLVRVILMLFNLRLGQWLPNPSRPPSDVSWPSWLSLFWGFLFWKPEDRAYCFVTDGGHLENTGIAALLRRRCRVIIALDASQDGECQFLDFNKVLQTARSQYGVRITDVVDDQETGRPRELDLAPLRSGPARDGEPDKSRSDAEGGKPPAPRGAATRARRHFLIARIEYPDGEQSRTTGMTSPEQRVGYLIYVKPTLTGDEPPAVLGFDAVSAEFPHDSTLDQFFDAARFDAYRALGEHLGEVVATELEGTSSRAGKESTAWLADWRSGAAHGDAAPVPIALAPPSPAPPAAAPVPQGVNADFEAQVERALEGLRANDEAARQHACVALDYWLSEQIAPAELLVRVLQEIMAAFSSAKDAATREQYCLTLIRLGEKRQSVREFLAKRAEDPQESDAVRFLCREHGRVES
jgi:hypothetical protein